MPLMKMDLRVVPLTPVGGPPSVVLRCDVYASADP